jgi:DNA-binding LacI/PurR family transcriptional regulator
MTNRSRITIKDVAKAANVSVATVSYVINGINHMVSEDTRERILQLIEDMGYVPNMTARALVKNESRLIGFFIPASKDLKHLVLRENPFYLEFIGGIENKALECGYNTMLVGIESEKNCRDMINSRNFAGVITFDFIDEGAFKVLEESNLPVVIIDDEVDKGNNVSYLNVDNQKGGYLAAEYLIKKGHKNIGYFTFGLEAYVAKQRLVGFRKALSEYNIAFDDRNILHLEPVDMVIDKIMNLNLTSVFCTGDVMAMNLMKGLYKRGIKVPDDISVVGFDDIAFCQFLMPALTTIRQDIFNKGAKAVEVILHNISNPKDKVKEYIMPVELIERETVK